MQKITYIHAASNQQWDWSLPRVIRIGAMAIMGVTEENMAAYGITKTVTDLPDPEPVDVPVHYSKLALCRALTSLGMWDGIKAAITEAGKWDEFLLAQDLSEDDPDFVAMKQALSELFPVEADEILRQCRIEENTNELL